jgi:eukaryotic-like serine/threonine-protein kinase
MTPGQWQKVKRLLDDAIELSPTERAAFLDSLSADEPEVRREVESLLRAHEAQPDFLEPPDICGAANDASGSDTSAAWLGRVLGSYRLLELIGEGGMGAIFRAVRADGLHDRPVAVKLIRSGLSKEFFLRRFNEERRILASLDHPNIARLLDGGASPEGMPYVVMEFVDGVPIDEFCARRQLSIRQRLELFRVVCGAVQYAHQNLIVHRDLKPANILVTSDGQPKLLDFGIAKIRDPRPGSEVERSLTLLPIMTPDFASPEQVRGAGITTASDIYSLGVILYVLLTGQRPYGSEQRTPHEIMKAICETAPLKPSGTVLRHATTTGAGEGTGAQPTPGGDSESRERSRLRRALRGDIDSIVLKTLRKEPHERYATVEQLSEDIRRHLEGLPVRARRGTAAYRVRKFIARHVAGVAVAAVVAGLLIASLVVSVREARVARVEAARAERRFNDVRELAGSLVFDVHDAIRDLPGSTPARKILIDRALKYLDGLSKESGTDRPLMRELAAAYERVGEVEGHFLQSNLGDAARSLDSYQRALQLRVRLASGDPHDPQDRLALASCRRRVANQLWATGNIRAARDEIAEAIAVAGALPQNLDVLTEESAEYNLQAEIFGNTEMGGLADSAAALRSVRREEQVVAAMLKLSPDSAEVQHSYQISILKLGDMLQADGDLQGALASFRQALDVAERLQQRSATTKNARQVAVAHNHVAVILDLLGDRAGSLSSSRESLEIYRQLLHADPRNELMQRGVAMADMNVGTQLALSGESTAGLRALDEGLTIAQSMVAADPKNLRDVSILAGIYEGRGDVRMQLRESQLAEAEYSKACELYERTRSADPGDAGDTVLAAECRTRLGRALLAQRRTEAGVKNYQQALVLLTPLVSAANPDVDALYLVADSYAGLGDSELARVGPLGATVVQDLGHWRGARSWYASSLDTWQKIPRTQYRRSPSLPVDSPDAVAEKLRRCERELASHLRTEQVRVR